MSRPYLAIALAAVLAAGCSKKKKDQPPPQPEPTQPATTEPATPPTSTAPTDVANRYLDYVAAINERDPKSLAAAIAPNAVFQLADSKDVLEGPDAVVKSNVDLWTAMPDIRIEPQLVLCRGNRVAALLLAHGTQTGDMKTPAGPLAPTQSETGSYGIELATVDHGLIRDGLQFWDVGLLMDQIRRAKGTRPPVTQGMKTPRVVVAPAGAAAQPAAAAALQAALDAVTAGNLEAVRHYFSDDAVLSVSALPADLTGGAAIAKALTQMHSAFPELTIEPHELWGTADLAVATATYKSKRGTLQVAHMVEAKDGHITRMWVVVNGAVLRQILAAK